MLLRAAFFSAALLGFALPARADQAAAPAWKYENPFCGVVAQVSTTGDGSTYAVGLFTGSGTTIDAHVTLVSGTDAYDAYITAAPLSGISGDKQAGLLTKVPDDARIQWFFVDSYSIDGGKPVGCPSYVFGVSDQTVNAPEGTRTIAATHLLALPPLKCGHAYIEPGVRQDLQSPVSMGYGNRPLTVVARSYIDSNGYSIREEIVQSSGVVGLDSYMLGAMHVHQFAPAQFLCTPVVSVIQVELEYRP